MAKKKKKKQRKGGQRPTYAKGKPVESSGKKKTTAVPEKKAASARAAKTPAKGAGDKTAPEREQWNLIRRDSREKKVFMLLLYVIIAAALLAYPLRMDEARHNYSDSQKELKKWQQKYPTKQEQKKHEKEKPVVPPKPTFGLILLGIFMVAIQSILFAFLGLNTSRRTDLKTPFLDKWTSEGFDTADLGKLLTYALPVGVVLLAPLIATDLIVKRYFPVPKGGRIKYPAWKSALFGINDGVQYQMLFVFLLFSALVWLFFRYQQQVKVDPHWPAMLAAFLFAVGYVYLVSGAVTAGERVGGGQMLAYASLLSLPFLILAYLYWKKGLEYSLLAGVVGFGIYPFLATLFIK